MIRIGVDYRLTYIAALLLAPMSLPGAWTSPVTLSSGGQGFEASAAIDGNGNSVAVWDERTTLDQLWSRAEPNGGAWGSVSEISPALQTTMVLPSVKVSTTGFATAVWSDSNGVWTADRPPASNWNSPRLLLPNVSNPIFVMDSQGDAAIAWTVGGPPGASSSVMAVLRPAGETWSAQQVITSGAYVIADHAAIGANGAVIVTWETFTAVCRRYGCSRSNFALHASRQNPGTGLWVDSGSLMGPDISAHDARPALDSAGNAMVLVLTSTGFYTSATQSGSGGAWSSFKNIFQTQGQIISSDLESNSAGQVTLVYESFAYPNSQVFAINGSIGGNSWSAPEVISGSDTSVGQIYFALAPNGAAVAIWLSSGATPVVHAVVRTTATGNWSSPVGISGAGNEISPEAAAVNPSGDAVAIYSGYDSSNNHIEYGMNFRP